MVSSGRSGLIWSRSGTKPTTGSGVSGAFTKDTNRASFSGSLMVAAHSSRYPATCAAISVSNSPQIPSESATTTSRTWSRPPGIRSSHTLVRSSRSAVRM